MLPHGWSLRLQSSAPDHLRSAIAHRRGKAHGHQQAEFVSGMFGFPSITVLGTRATVAAPLPAQAQYLKCTFQEGKLGSIRKVLSTHVSHVRWLQVICKLFRQQRENESGKSGKNTEQRF